MRKSFLLLSSAIMLSACAYTFEKHIQDIEVQTPGARGSVCYMFVDGLEYRVYPPQVMNVDKSKEDLVIDCVAPGNRRKKVVIEPQIVDKFYANVGNGFIGLPFDVLSNAMYEYPSVVVVDFTNSPVRPEAPPAQNASDIKQPEEYFLEEFGPETMRLNSDRYNQSYTIKKRERTNDYAPSRVEMQNVYDSPEYDYTAPDITNPELQSIIDDLNSTDPMPPADTGALEPSSSAPVTEEIQSIEGPSLDSLMELLDE